MSTDSDSDSVIEMITFEIYVVSQTITTTTGRALALERASAPTATTPDAAPAATTPDSEPAATTPDSAPAATTPDSAPAATTPDSAPAATTPDSAPAATTPNSVPAATTTDSASTTTPDSAPTATIPDSEPAEITPDSAPAATTPDSAPAASTPDSPAAAAPDSVPAAATPDSASAEMTPDSALAASTPTPAPTEINPAPTEITPAATEITTALSLEPTETTPTPTKLTRIAAFFKERRVLSLIVLVVIILFFCAFAYLLITTLAFDIGTLEAYADMHDMDVGLDVNNKSVTVGSNSTIFATRFKITGDINPIPDIGLFTLSIPFLQYQISTFANSTYKISKESHVTVLNFEPRETFMPEEDLRQFRFRVLRERPIIWADLLADYTWHLKWGWWVINGRAKRHARFQCSIPYMGKGLPLRKLKYRGKCVRVK